MPERRVPVVTRTPPSRETSEIAPGSWARTRTRPERSTARAWGSRNRVSVLNHTSSPRGDQARPLTYSWPDHSVAHAALRVHHDDGEVRLAAVEEGDEGRRRGETRGRSRHSRRGRLDQHRPIGYSRRLTRFSTLRTTARLCPSGDQSAALDVLQHFARHASRQRRRGPGSGTRPSGASEVVGRSERASSPDRETASSSAEGASRASDSGLSGRLRKSWLGRPSQDAL